MKHEPLIRRVPLANEVSSYWNKFNSEDGILITVETDTGIHHIHLGNEAAISLRDMLINAVEDWKMAAIK